LPDVVGKKPLEWFVGGRAEVANANTTKKEEEIELYFSWLAKPIKNFP